MKDYKPPFEITLKIVELVSSIMEKVGKVNSYSSLEKMPQLRRNNRIKSIHSSLSIEANSLSLNEVKDVINGKFVVGNEEEIIEVKNAYKAYELIGKVNPYNIKDLLKIQETLIKDIKKDAGKFRESGEGVFDGDKCIFVAPPKEMVPVLMNKLFSWMTEYKDKVHPLILSSVFHYEFVFTHPFSEGNGRTARLWQNIILSDFNGLFAFLPIENTIKHYQQEYYSSIDICNKNGSSTVFIEFMLKMIDEVLNDLDKESKNLNLSLNKNINDLLNILTYDNPISANEIMVKLYIKSKETLREKYLNPAINEGLIKCTLPDKPTSKNQMYYKI